ncbi:MAG TPA: hypothetical protein VEP89_03715 [Draconibacterium sp.]|nr:hypothetical protein [Draconibacterium sp.]
MKRYLSALVLLTLLIGCSKVDQTNCLIENIELHIAECLTDSTILINISSNNEVADINSLSVFNGDVPLGAFDFNELPLEIEAVSDFDKDSSSFSVCVTEHPNCCKDFMLALPNCSNLSCTITELSVDPGECTGNNMYNLFLNFSYENTGNDFFNVFGREDKLIGTYKLADLPINIENFEASGNDYDFIKVCINDRPDCCKVAEFLAPNCAAECTITELSVDRGECINDSTYSITINFTYSNPGNDFFEVFGRDNKYYGYFNLSELPVTINEFRKSDNEFDLVKVCINDNENCCKLKEIESPNCND